MKTEDIEALGRQG